MSGGESMDQTLLARNFCELHRRGDPLILFNVWDAGSAVAVARAGATAIATGSWSVAHAQGFDDGQDMPLEFALQILARIVVSVDLPVTYDFEAGYAENLKELETNAERVIAAGAIGVNFEDRMIGTTGLRGIAAQCDRIAALRRASQSTGIDLFVNARTDVFFRGAPPEAHADLMDEAATRARAYAEAGADGLFVPGLTAPALIDEICAASPLPVNIMQTGKAPDQTVLAALGVARISHGPAPFLATMTGLSEAAATAL